MNQPLYLGIHKKTNLSKIYSVDGNDPIKLPLSLLLTNPIIN